MALHTEEINMSKLKNVHPGEILLEEFLIPLGISQNRGVLAWFAK